MREPPYPIEFERTIAALNETGVRYVIVDGVAVVLHGVDRLTADLDIFIDLDAAAASKGGTIQKARMIQQISACHRPASCVVACNANGCFLGAALG